MNKVLVAYATMAGSTLDVAEAVGTEIAKQGIQVDVLPIREVVGIQGYDGVVVGGPMIMGWHREARGFLKKHKKAFQQVPLAVFVMAMSLTETRDVAIEGVSITIDNNLPKPPKEEKEDLVLENGTRGWISTSPQFECYRAGETSEHRDVWRPAGIWAFEVVGCVIRDAGDQGSCWRSQKLGCDPLLGSRVTGLAAGRQGRIKCDRREIRG